ncbi:MAG: hypothetical protein RBT11_14255 [Desulfobacterales bacterium]|jgi:hypothetical protein|nr:hypothetical protein [Desulfobacterales bacterium]
MIGKLCENTNSKSENMMNLPESFAIVGALWAICWMFVSLLKESEPKKSAPFMDDLEKRAMKRIMDYHYGTISTPQADKIEP